MQTVHGKEHEISWPVPACRLTSTASSHPRHVHPRLPHLDQISSPTLRHPTTQAIPPHGIGHQSCRLDTLGHWAASQISWPTGASAVHAPCGKESLSSLMSTDILGPRLPTPVQQLFDPFPPICRTAPARSAAPSLQGGRRRHCAEPHLAADPQLGQPSPSQILDYWPSPVPWTSITLEQDNTNVEPLLIQNNVIKIAREIRFELLYCAPHALQALVRSRGNSSSTAAEDRHIRHLTILR